MGTGSCPPILSIIYLEEMHQSIDSLDVFCAPVACFKRPFRTVGLLLSNLTRVGAVNCWNRIDPRNRGCCKIWSQQGDHEVLSGLTLTVSSMNHMVQCKHHAVGSCSFAARLRIWAEAWHSRRSLVARQKVKL